MARVTACVRLSAPSLLNSDVRWYLVVLSEITEAQQNQAIQAVRAAGLDADVIYDDDLEARAILGRKNVGGMR